MKKKKVLIVSETPPSSSSTGACQTLHNIFQNYGSEDLIILSPDRILKEAPVNPTVSKAVFGFKTSFLYFGKFRSRFPFSLLGRIIEYFILKASARRIIQIVEKYRPDILFISNSDYHAIRASHLILRKFDLPVFIYLQDNINYSIGKTHTDRVNSIMHRAQGWLLISEYMYEDIVKKYGNGKKPFLIVHNPVDRNLVADVSDKRSGETLRLAYAGAIWPMHFDALEKLIRSFSLVGNFRIEFVIYADKKFWKSYEGFFQKHQVIYGGFYPFHKVKEKLALHDGLVVTSSFAPEVEILTRYSVQTKITDYMAAGVPVISIGPEYSACNRFIRKRNLGTVIESKVPEDIAKALEKFVSEYQEKIRLAVHARKVVLENHTQDVVERKVFDFLHS